MEKSKSFRKAIANVTYADVLRMFNELNKTLRGEFYTDAKDLQRPEGGKAIGFIYTGYAAGVGLRNILDTIGIKYNTFMKKGTGIEEESEIHIDAKDEKRVLDIIEKIGHVQSNVSKEIKITGNKALNDRLKQQVR